MDDGTDKKDKFIKRNKRREIVESDDPQRSKGTQQKKK